MKKTIIGMIHLPPLPGYKHYPGMKTVVKKALRDLDALEKGGVDGVLIENENDHPHEMKPGPVIIAAMTHVASQIVQHASVPFGVQVLLNDPEASLAIAQATGASFIRTDYFVDKMWRDGYGVMEINPAQVMAFKENIGAKKIKIFADVQVKYAKLLEKGKTISQSTKQAINAGADAIVVTGDVSGQTPQLPDLKEAKLAASNVPVYVGSGFSVQNAKQLLKFSDGAIVGTSLKTQGNVDVKKVKALMEEL